MVKILYDDVNSCAYLQTFVTTVIQVAAFETTDTISCRQNVFTLYFYATDDYLSVSIVSHSQSIARA